MLNIKNYLTKVAVSTLVIFYLFSLPPSFAADQDVVSEPDTTAADIKSDGETEEFSGEEAEEDFGDDEFDDFADDEFGEEAEDQDDAIYDPLEPFNRVMFEFNDKLYFWVLKPVAKGYRFVVPEKGRIGVKRFFSNITTPVRFVNSILQLKFKAAGIELSRFVINSTIGVAGFMDPARKFGFEKQDEDLGQTLGHYGMGPGFYICLPFLGPSSLRDTIGWTGDLFADPLTYILPNECAWHMPGIRCDYNLNNYLETSDLILGITATAYKMVNETSVNINLYDDNVKDAFDPYTFLKNAYHQNRKKRIKE